MTRKKKTRAATVEIFALAHTIVLLLSFSKLFCEADKSPRERERERERDFHKHGRRIPEYPFEIRNGPQKAH